MARERTVALLLDDPANLYQQLQARDAPAAAAALGIRLLPAEWAAGSPWSQLESINGMLRQETPPDGVILMLAGKLTRGPAERLTKAGLAVVFIQRIPDWVLELQTTYTDTLVAAVGPRHETLGEIQARHALRLAPEGGFALMLAGDLRTPAATRRKQGFLDAVGDKLEVQVLDGAWTAEGAERALGKWFRSEPGRRIDLVVSANDTMAIAARRVLAQHGVDVASVPHVGCDGLEQEGKPALARGELQASVFVPPTTPKALELLAAFWKSGARPEGVAFVDVVSLPPLPR